MKARVTLVSPALDPGSTTIEVWVEARKPDRAATGNDGTRHDDGKDGERRGCCAGGSGVSERRGWRLRAGCGKRREGAPEESAARIRNGESAQVVSGLNEGEPVITSGAMRCPMAQKSR